MMMTQIPKKRVLVTGASSGIGAATARRFAAEGWDVYLTALDARGLEEVKAGLAPGAHRAMAGDYADPAFASRLEAGLKQEWDSLDALINCAGAFIGTSLLETPLPQWHKAFLLMVDGAIHMTRLAAPLLPPGGRIVHVSSIHAGRAAGGASAYAMAKAALEQACRALAVELAPRGILVNAIAPGFVDTPMSVQGGVNELDSEWFKENYVRGDHLPLRRAGKAEEVAGVAYFLAGPDSSYVTGQTITVDGGLTITF